jgi:type I restriction enzyme S subunit
VAVSGITGGDLAELHIPVPPIWQQKRCVDVLQLLDDRITLLRETNATLETIAQAMFKSWFVDLDPVRAKMAGRAPEGMDEATAALFPDAVEETELGLVPKGWRWGALGDLATFQNGYAFKSKDWTETGHPVVKIGDVKPGIIDLVGCSYVAQQTVVGLDRFQLARGDLLVGMTGYVGETGLVPAVEPAAYLNQRVGRIATKSGVADLGYVYCVARSPAFKEFAEAQSHGSAQANVSGASLMAFPAVIAPAPLMECFNSAVFGMLEGILANYEQAQTLSAVRDTLLPRLISGQLRLPELLETEVA